MTTQKAESITWDGIVVYRGEVHVETAASWASRKDLQGEALDAVFVETLCGAEPLVRNGKVFVVNDQEVRDVVLGRRQSEHWDWICQDCRHKVANEVGA